MEYVKETLMSATDDLDGGKYVYDGSFPAG